MSDLVSDRTHAARKWYWCDNCRSTIFTGQKYRRLFGAAFSGDKKREMKLCMRCTSQDEDGHTVLILNSD
jgi:hypothetical protein